VTSPPPAAPATLVDALRQTVADAARGVLTFPRDLHGFPGVVHGGAVGALCLRLALPRPPFRLRLDLQRGVPTETPIRFTSGSAGTEAQLAFFQGDRLLAEGRLSRETGPDAVPAPVRAARAARPTPRGEMPGTATCLACGSANPIGLGVRFQYDDRLVWREVTPPAGYRGKDGATHPALAPILLDELGWWMGALAQRECGVTTEVAITVHRALPWGPVLAVGDRTAIRADDDPRGRYCRVTGYLLGPDGALLATGEVRFAGSRAYTRRLLQPFLETTSLEALSALFPGAADLATRA
jgi:hypothetical protein